MLSIFWLAICGFKKNARGSGRKKIFRVILFPLFKKKEELCFMMMPKVFYQSNYYVNGFPTQNFDGKNFLPVSGRAVIVPSNIRQEFDLNLKENRPVTSSSGSKLSLLNSSIRVNANKLHHSVVYESNISSNESAFGYFVKKKPIKTIKDIDYVIILSARNRSLYQGMRFPLIGGSFQSSAKPHPFLKDQTIDEISMVSSYAFEEKDEIGFVSFIRCWDKDQGLVIKWENAFWTEPQLNPDFKVLKIPYAGYHYITYIRDLNYIAPVTSSIRFLGVEDTRSDWGSDRDFNDIGFTLISENNVFELQNLTSNTIPSGFPHMSGDITLDSTGLYAIIGIPQNKFGVGSVAILQRKFRESSQWDLLQMIDGPEEVKSFGFTLALKSHCLVVSCQTENQIGKVIIYHRKNETFLFEEVSQFIGDWWNALFGYTIALNDDGDRLVVGVQNAKDGTCAKIFQCSKSMDQKWTWTQDLKVSARSDSTITSGFSLAISGNGLKIAVGSSLDALSNGRVWYYVFKNNKFEDAIDLDIPPLASNAEVGKAVAFNKDGNLLAVTIPSNNSEKDAMTVLFAWESENVDGIINVNENVHLKSMLKCDPVSLPYVGKLSIGNQVQMSSQGNTVVVSGVFRFNSIEYFRTLLIFKKQQDDSWMIVQCPILSGLETNDNFGPSKFALCANGLSLLVRDVANANEISGVCLL